MFLLERIRANVHTANVPVVVVARGDATEFLANGAQDCFAPPATAEAIRWTAQRHMRGLLDFTLAPEKIIAQPERMAALQETGLLDSAPEESFDRLTRMASRLLGVSTALVSLVDKDRQFFKSQVGMAEPWAGARQTRLSHSFCQWVVAGKEEVVVEDAHQVPALRNNLAVKDMGVIAYAGVPISTSGGNLIGSFCAIESKPRAWSPEDLETLRDLRQVSEAYAALDQAQRSKRPASSPGNLQTSVHVAGKAVIGAARILRRYGSRMEPADHTDLLAIIEEQGEHLVALAPDPH
jgi:GAF domain-containing protein